MSEFMVKFKAYGADMEGVMDRFMEDEELLQMCLAQFAGTEDFEQLTECIYKQSYEEAFDVAHALKGVTGNLGLTPLFDAICVLVEALRAHVYDQVEQQLEDVLKQKELFMTAYGDMI